MSDCAPGDAVWAYGSEIWRSDGDANNQTWTQITFITELNPPGGTSAEIETTHHGTPDGFTTFISGLKTTDNVACTVNYDPQNASHQMLYNDWLSGCQHTYKFIMKSRGTVLATFEFTGFVASFSIQTPLNDRATAQVAFKPSGKPELY